VRLDNVHELHTSLAIGLWSDAWKATKFNSYESFFFSIFNQSRF